MDRRPLSAVVGLGFSELSRRSVGSTRDLAAAAVNAAVADAGLKNEDIDGLLLCRSPSAPAHVLPLTVQNDLGLRGLRLLSSVEGEGTSVVQAVQQATLALQSNMASAVVCVFSEARLQGSSTGGTYSKAMPLTGIEGWEAQYGLFGAAGPYALAARRSMARYGVTENDLGAYAIACRRWAQLNPSAFLRQPLSLEQYLESRWVVEPFRILDCAYPVNGAIAVVLTSLDRAADLPRVPVYVHGMGQGHTGQPSRRGFDLEAGSGAVLAGTGAYRMAGITAQDVSMCQFYDPFSHVGLQLLEDYGLCKRGEAAALVRGAHTSPGGRLPVNTGGGHLSGFYLQGMTPLSEAVIQGRGEAGNRQVPNRDVILVSGVGGRLDYHAALVMSPLRSLS
jgi:acetyl-CoA acetyltransferase